MNKSEKRWSGFSNTANSNVEELEALASQPDFWDHPAEARETLRQLDHLRTTLQPWFRMEQQLQELDEMAQLAQEQQDEAFALEVAEATAKLQQELHQARLCLALQGPRDQAPAIITLTSGAGGTDSHDWVEILLGMYTAWAKAEARPTKLMNLSHAERAGLRTATIEIAGPHAYGRLREETGIHRVARVSKFDPAGRRQTSFARVEVLPAVPESSPVEPDPKDLRTDTFHASGPGGQHIHKVATAVRIKHLPTGIVVACQTERSQKQNRDYAMRILRARLLERHELEQKRERLRLRGTPPPPRWGYQVRSYFLRPQHLVLDHRTGHRDPDPQRVLAGNLEGFIEAALLLRSST